MQIPIDTFLHIPICTYIYLHIPTLVALLGRATASAASISEVVLVTLNLHWIYIAYTWNIHWIYAESAHMLTYMYIYVHICTNAQTYLLPYTYIYLHWLHCWGRATASAASVSEVVRRYPEYTLNIHCIYIAYTLNIHWIYIEYTLYIHWIYTEYTLNIHWIRASRSLLGQVHGFGRSGLLYDPVARLFLGAEMVLFPWKKQHFGTLMSP